MVYIPWNSGGSLVDIAMKHIEPSSALHFDPGDARLWVDGRESQLTPTQASMLRYFAFNSNRVISKQELLDMVWPDTHVTEALVKDYVRRLRRILDDDPSQPRFIETVRGMGYRFVGSVSISGVDDVTQSAGAASRSAPSIAVLPFTDASDGDNQAYFSAGFAEDIVAELSRFRSLVVIARDSSFSYDAQTAAAIQVGRELDVQYVLRGSVRRAGDRLRIHAQLIEADSDVCVWADRYDRRLVDVFAVQAEVSAAIVSTLVGYLEDFGRRQAARKEPNDLAVYDYLLLGNWHLRQGGRLDVFEARRLYRRAIELEPTYARAHAELAFSYLQEFWSDWTEDYKAAVDMAYALAKKAVALDELDGRAHLYLAVTHRSAASNFDLAEAQFRMAHKLNPNDYDVFCLMAWHFALSGKAEEGIACAAHAIRLSPLTTEDCYGAQCIAAYSAGHYEEALITLSSIAEPSNIVNAYRAMCYAQLGRESEARQAMAHYLANASTDMAAYPGTDSDRWRQYWAVNTPFKDPKDLEHLLDGLHKAGLP
jgi:TolB-like protein/Flp pilus assembly protein TadD